ncbi:MAG: hypothetical protein WCG75_00340 [Armatimonadota bacterium]
MIVSVLTGCAKPKPGDSNNAASNNSPANTKKAEPFAVAIGPAEDTRTEFVGPKGNQTREIQWHISWQSANIAIVNGKQSGFMFKVKGEAYEKGEIASTFFADHAEADKAVNRLILDGGIKVTSKRTKTELAAKKVEWLADLKLFKASGEVTLVSESGVVGPVDALYTNSDLSKVASSKDYFKK